MPLRSCSYETRHRSFPPYSNASESTFRENLIRSLLANAPTKIRNVPLAVARTHNVQRIVCFDGIARCLPAKSSSSSGTPTFLSVNAITASILRHFSEDKRKNTFLTRCNRRECKTFPKRRSSQPVLERNCESHAVIETGSGRG